MTKFFSIALVAVFAAAVVLLPKAAFADAAAVGDILAGDLNRIVRGNLGVIIGLLVALFGLYTWLIEQSSWGIVLIIGGVAITAFPGFFVSMQDSFQELFVGSGATERTAPGAYTRFGDLGGTP